jgi:beta-N-acetylhexosaminidase
MRSPVRGAVPLLMALLAAALLTGCISTAIAEPYVSESTTTSASTTTTEPPPTPAELILEQMTLRDKAAQVLWVAFAGKSVNEGTVRKLIEESPMGGLILLQQNVGGPKTMRSLTAGIQKVAKASGSPVQVFIGADQEGGRLSRITTGMPRVPWARVLGAESTPERAGELAASTAWGLMDLGVNLNLAPVADVAPEGDYMGDRSFGNDPALVSSFVSAVVEGYEANGMVSVAKHFPGHGSVDDNSHEERVVSEASAQAFETIHLPPFKTAIEAGVEGVMLSHIRTTAYDPDNPASRSPVLIGMLRDEWGYDGLIVTDSICMWAAQGGVGVEEAAIRSLEAGVDVCIVIATAGKELKVRDAIVQAVEQGRLSQERLDQAVLRLIEVKLRHGLVNSD